MADLTNELLDILGEADFVTLVEHYGGLRLFVPGDIARSELTTIVGSDIATRLSKRYPGGYIRVPLARELRAGRYRQAGMSNRDIAKALGCTESSVDKIVRRGKRRSPKAFARPKDPRQTSLLDLLGDEE
ncbi:helix-turn-helix domain-containing protein [Shinella pollutisoli]|uniref:Helix-turn-helix domain-containing protein n=1 Tax=Shinella pollutisoli TaxID=2250594 RepID=A0ABV7DJQ5_9HYPH|nr:helix-turn-helix domain-containing protein [Shinella pollutisoli]